MMFRKVLTPIFVVFVSRSLIFGCVDGIKIDNQLKVITNDCYERLAIGHRLNSRDIYKTVKANTVPKCQKECTKEGDVCKAFSYGIAVEGNSTCELGRNFIKETATLQPIGTIANVDFDLYIKKLGCKLVIDPNLNKQSKPTFSNAQLQEPSASHNQYDKPTSDVTKPSYLPNQHTTTNYNAEITPKPNGKPPSSYLKGDYNKPSEIPQKPDVSYGVSIPNIENVRPDTSYGNHKPSSGPFHKPTHAGYDSISKYDSQHVQGSLVSISTGPQSYLHPIHEILIGENPYNYGRPKPDRPYGYLPDTANNVLGDSYYPYKNNNRKPGYQENPERPYNGYGMGEYGESYGQNGDMLYHSRPHGGYDYKDHEFRPPSSDHDRDERPSRPGYTDNPKFLSPFDPYYDERPNLRPSSQPYDDIPNRKPLSGYDRPLRPPSNSYDDKPVTTRPPYTSIDPYKIKKPQSNSYDNNKPLNEPSKPYEYGRPQNPMNPYDDERPVYTNSYHGGPQKPLDSYDHQKPHNPVSSYDANRPPKPLNYGNFNSIPYEDKPYIPVHEKPERPNDYDSFPHRPQYDDQLPPFRPTYLNSPYYDERPIRPQNPRPGDYDSRPSIINDRIDKPYYIRPHFRPNFWEPRPYPDEESPRPLDELPRPLRPNFDDRRPSRPGSDIRKPPYDHSKPWNHPDDFPTRPHNSEYLFNSNDRYDTISNTTQYVKPSTGSFDKENGTQVSNSTSDRGYSNEDSKTNRNHSTTNPIVTQSIGVDGEKITSIITPLDSGEFLYYNIPNN